MRHHRLSEGMTEELEPSMAMSVLLWSPVVRSSGVPVSWRRRRWRLPVTGCTPSLDRC